MQVFRVWKWCNLILFDKGYFNSIRSSLLNFCWIARLSFSVVFSSILRYSQVTVIGTNREQLRYVFQSWLYARSIAIFIVSLYKSLFKHTGQGIYELENSSRTWTNFEWWQWCWWHRYVGDFMMVTDLRWWQNHYVDDFFSLCWWFSQCIKSVTNILNRSPTSQTCRQHIWSPTSVTNIDVTFRVHLYIDCMIFLIIEVGYFLSGQFLPEVSQDWD